MHQIRVLLADDDIDDREMFTEILGFREEVRVVKTAENGQEVIEYLSTVDAAELPDLIILDHNMPKMNGRQTLEYLKGKDQFAKIPVILYSTYSDQNLEEEAKKLGVSLIATKPSSYHEYTEMIEQFISIARASNA